MAIEVQHSAHGIDKSYNESKSDYKEHAKLLNETNDKQAQDAVKANHEKAAMDNTGNLPQLELIDGKAKVADSRHSEPGDEHKEKPSGSAEEKKRDSSLPTIELVDSKQTADNAAKTENSHSKTKDTNVAASSVDDAGRLNKAIEETHTITGRSQANCEKDMRDTIATLHSKDIAKLNAEYQKRFGNSFATAIEADNKISDETKAALSIYMKGADQRTDEDTLDLAALALKSKNLDMFQEAFREASVGARKQYLDDGGLAKVEKAFSKDDQAHALDYVAAGKDSTVTKIHDNSSSFGDNEKAIDAALKSMSDDERNAYIHGKELAEKFPESSNKNNAAYDKLSPQEKADYDRYRQVNDALKKVGNENEVLRWDDLVVNKEQTLVGKMAEHGGLVNDKVDKVLADIENMSKADFERLKAEPNYRKEVEQAISANYRGDDLEQSKALLEKKLSFNSFEEAQVEGNRATVDALKNKFGIWGPDDRGILDTLQKMSVDEQKRYRADAEYKKQIDTLVEGAFHGRMQEVDAKRILEDVNRGEKPQEDIVGKLALQAYQFSGDKSAMLGEIETAFKEEPSLREHLLNPQTETEQATAKQFHEYARRAFGTADYERYVQPLVEKGVLPFEQKAAISNGVFENDIKGVLAAIKTAGQDERADIVAHPEESLSFLNKEERRLALSVAEHNGEMRPEDKMRAAVLGISGDKEVIKELGSQLSAPERVQLVKDYEREYGRNLVSDLTNKLSGQEEIDAVANFKGLLQTARESFNDARDEEYRSNDGLGRSFVRNYWDGTSDAGRNSLNQYAASMIEYAKADKEMSAEQSAKLKSDLAYAMTLYRESKGAAADAVVDGTIIAVGVGGAAFTGGVSLGLISTVGVAGAGFKVSTKSVLMGTDYDLTSREALTDAASGAVESATVVLGPVQMAKMLHLGEKAANAAGETVISQSTQMSKITGKQILKEGAGETLSKDLAKEVATGLAQGAKEIDEKALDKLAQKYAISEVEQADVKALITKSLNEAISAESGSALKSTLREVALNSGAGAIAGGSTGTVEGIKQWDSTKELGENLQVVGEQTLTGAAFGGAMGAGATVGFKAMGQGFESARNLASEHFSGNGDIANIAGELILDANGRIAQINGPNPAKVSYHETGNLEGVVKKVEMADGTSYESIGSGKYRISDSVGGQHEVEAKVTVSHTGDIEIKQADGNTKTISGLNGSSKEFFKVSGETHLRDADGHLLELEARNGHRTNYKYDDSGNLSNIKFDNGHSIISEDGGKSWLIRDSAGGTKTLKGLVALDGDGNLHVKSGESESLHNSNQGNVHNNGERHKPSDVPSQNLEQELVFRKDGSYSHIDPVTEKPSDLVRADRNRSHEKYEYDKDGSLAKLTYMNGNYLKRSPHDSTQMLEFHKSGRLINDMHEGVSIEPNGVKITNFGDNRETVDFTDGGTVLRTADASHKILQERPPTNIRDTNPDDRLSADTLEQRKFIEKQFASTEKIDDPKVIRQVELDLKAVKTTGDNGESTSIYQNLVANETLSAMQKENIIRNLAQVHEYLTGFGKNASMPADAADSWLHTQGAVPKVLDAAAANKLNARETEDALLASIYSRSIKSGDGAVTNSAASNLDGALVAQHVLSRDGFTPQRVEGIVDAIKAKQIANLGNELPDRQLEPGFKQLSRNEQEDILSRSRIAQTVLDADDSVPKLTADNTPADKLDTNKLTAIENSGDKSLQQAQTLELPGIRPEEVKAGAPVWESAEHHLKAWRSEQTNFLYVMDTQSKTMRTFDSDNRLKNVISGDSSREIRYDSSGAVESVSIKNRVDSEPSLLSAGFRQDIHVDADGTVKIIKHTIDGDEVARHNLDGSMERILSNGRIQYEKADFAYEKNRLEAIFQVAFNDSANKSDLARVNSYMETFETAARNSERNIDQNSQALLYKQLNRLLADNPDAQVSFSKRLDLAEQALHHSAEPQFVAQGQNMTCNVTTVEHRIYWRNPDKNVQILADVAHSGKYRFADGTEVDLHNATGNLSPSREASENFFNREFIKPNQFIDDSQVRPIARQLDGTRDFSSEIIQTAMVNSRWKQADIIHKIDAVDGEGRQLTIGDIAMRYDKDGNAKGIVNEHNLKQLFDEAGNPAKEIKPGAKYFYNDGTAPVDKLSNWQATYSKEGKLLPIESHYNDGIAIDRLSESQIVYSKEGQLQGIVIDEKDIHAVFDVTGKKVNSDFDSKVPSGKLFDEKGNLLVSYSQPGDITYQRVPVGEEGFDAERLILDVSGQNKELKHSNGKPINNPKLSAYSDLLPISNNITGLQEKPFVLVYGKQTGANALGFNSEQEFTDVIRKLVNENNGPGVLRVDTTHPPFNQPPQFTSDGRPANGHVINIHKISELPEPNSDSGTKLMVHISNQWGQASERYELNGKTYDMFVDGYPLELLYQATKPYKP